MLVASFVLSILIQVGLPIFIAWLLVRRYQTEWRLVAVGVMSYLVFQVVQAPLFQTLSTSDFYQSQIATLPPVALALAVGFLTALLEQGIRTGGFWIVRKSIARVEQGLTVTAGHAGVESLLIGFQFLINFIFAISITSQGIQALNLSETEAAQLQTQINAFWALPWYLPLAAMLQRLALLALQFALGLMVWLAVSRRLWLWLAVSVLWYTANSAVATVLSSSMPDLVNTAIFLLVGLVNAGIVYLLVRKVREGETGINHRDTEAQRA